jgi:O-methyltransferase
MSLQQTRDRIVDNYNPSTRLTMLTPELLDNIEYCIRDVVDNKVEGDFIECGVWRGGACIYAYYVLKELDEKRKVYVADSFQGLPQPNVELYPQDEGDIHWKHSELAVSSEKVKQNFEIFGPIDESVVFVEGFFKDSLPECDIEKISVLRLDGDMYESTMDSLKHLYHKLEIGGYCIVDDYSGVIGCTKAVDDFREKYDIDDEMKLCQPVPCESGFHPASVFWKKTKQISI